MAETEVVPGLAQIGATLRAGRESRGLSLDQAAARLRCDVRVIESLEAGRFADIGPPVFARGHLLRYAELVDAPGEAMVAEWAGLADGSAASELMADTHPRRTRDLRLLRRRLVAGTAILCAAIVAVWSLQQFSARNRAAAAPPSAAAGTTSAATPAAGTPAGAPAVAPGAAEGTTQAATGVATAGSAAMADPGPAAPDGAAGGSPAAVARGSGATPSAAPQPPRLAAADVRPAPPSADTSAAASAPPAAPAPAAGRAPTAQLAVTASAESWLEIYDRRNRRLFFGVARPGTLVDVRGSLPLRVVVGNVPATTFELDGRRVEVPREAMRTRRAATFRVGPDGRLTAWPRA